MSDEYNIKQVINNWYKYKKDYDDLSKRIDRCKEIIKNYMDENNANIIVSDNHIVKRTKNYRESLNRKDIPEDIWSKYKKGNEYWLYKVSEK